MPYPLDYINREACKQVKNARKSFKNLDYKDDTSLEILEGALKARAFVKMEFTLNTVRKQKQDAHVAIKLVKNAESNQDGGADNEAGASSNTYEL